MSREKDFDKEELVADFNFETVKTLYDKLENCAMYTADLAEDGDHLFRLLYKLEKQSNEITLVPNGFRVKLKYEYINFMILKNIRNKKLIESKKDYYIMEVYYG